MTKKKSLVKPVIALASIFVIIVVAILLIPSKQKQVTLIDTIPKTANELIFNDILSENFSSKNTTVFGISVGMSEEDVLAKLGPADKVNEFDFGAIKNWEYAERIGLNSTGVLYHFEKGTVTRITISPSLNNYLQGTSKVGKSKTEVYNLFGIPERQFDMTKGRFFVYNQKGFEVYLNTNGEYQYAFVYPMRKLPTTAYIAKNKTKEELFNEPIPILIIDTTTLCDQGKTFGEDPATQECKDFKNSCEIPDEWIEVSTCRTNSTNTTKES